ncbi:unnamed protein product [Lymnaea stagnalis]|uniref:Cytochrome P450 n=1 Tax=Lymnaea stagnalis TaxID=6523 RepID=A0AAV2IE28_LYMST
METVIEGHVWIVLIVCALILFYTYGKSPLYVWKTLGVPGPEPTVFFGNIHQLFDARVGVRHSVKQWQKQYGRIFGIYFFRKPVIVVTEPEALKQIFVKDFNVFVDRFFVGDGRLQHRIIQRTVFFSQGATWRRLRKMMTPSFSSGKLKSLSPYINRTAHSLSDHAVTYAKQGKHLDAKVVFGAYALDVIAGTAFGLDLDSQSDHAAPFIRHAKSLMTIDKVVQLKLTLVGMFPAVIPLFRALKIGYFKRRDIKFFSDNLQALIAERITSGKSNADFLQLLMEAEFDSSDPDSADKKLTSEEVAAQCLFFMIAGYDTTSTTLQYLFYELVRHQDVQGKIVAEILSVVGASGEPSYDHCQKLKYLEAAIEETLRMYPPLHILTRKTTRDTTLNGVFIPANSGVLIPAYNIGRDPEFFRDPDTFVPERFLDADKHDVNPVTFLPFGYGSRQCIGMRLALMQLKLAAVHVLRRLKVVSATPEVLEIEDFSGTLVPKTPIQLFMEVRSV